MNLTVRLSLLALAAGCSGSPTSASPPPPPPPATVHDVPQEAVHEGEVDESPRFGQPRNFRVAMAGSKAFQRFYVAPFTRTHEADGLADPTRPSGPDNRRFETTEGLSVVAIDPLGQMVPRADLPAPVRDLHQHLETHLGVQSEGVVVKLGDAGFSEALTRFAAAEYGLTVETGFTDPVAGSGELDSVVAKICAEAPCVGRFSRIGVFRDPAGTAQRLRYDGDLEVCSHPPRVYFDITGNEIGTIPEKPIESEAEGKAFARRQQALTDGLEQAESLSCP